MMRKGKKEKGLKLRKRRTKFVWQSEGRLGGETESGYNLPLLSTVEQRQEYTTHVAVRLRALPPQSDVRGAFARLKILVSTRGICLCPLQTLL